MTEPVFVRLETPTPATEAAMARAAVSAAQAEAEAAADAAATAQGTADAAQTDATQAAADAAAADAAAVQAAADAAAAQATADAADTAAATASASAAAAQTQANTALSAAQTAQATADGAIRTYYQSTPPTGLNATTDLGDLWFDTDDNQAYRWSGTAWIVIQDNSIAAALQAAQNAQTTADGKITSYYQTGIPTVGELGDLWYDTNDQNQPYYCSSISPLTWTSLRDGTIADAATQAQQAVDAAAAADTAAAQAAADAAAAQATADAAAADAAAAQARFPIDTTDIQDGGITTPKLAANAIDGLVITGATLRTAASGQRVVINDVTSPNIIDFHTGDGAETASGRVSGESVSPGVSILNLVSPRLGATTSGISLRATTVAGGAEAAIEADLITLTGPVEVEDSAKFGANGTTVSLMRHGFSTAAPVAGIVTIAHGCGVIPSAILVTGTGYYARVTSYTATNFTVELRSVPSLALGVAGLAAAFSWMAIVA